MRRIEAVTGEAAEALVYGMQDIIRTSKAFFNNVPDLTGAIRRMVEENAAFKKQVEEFARLKAVEFARKLSTLAVERNGVKLIVADSVTLSDSDTATMRNAALSLQKELENTALVAAWESEGKPQLLLMYSNDLVKKGRNAGKDIREAAKFIQGGGGGQPGLATAGGRDSSGLKDALEALTAIAVS